MRASLFTILATALFLAVGPKSSAGGIVEETYHKADGEAVSGWVYQSSRTWRYARAARYPYYFYPGVVTGFYGGYYGGCRTTFVTPRVHRTHFTAPAVRSIPRATAVRPTFRSSPAPVRSNIRASIRPNVVPTVRPSTVRPSTRAGVSRGTTTVRVYRRPSR